MVKSYSQVFVLNVQVLLLSIILFSPGISHGQKLFANKAELNESRYHYQDASDVYLGFLKNGDRNAALKAAMNLYKGRKYREALPLYELADSLRIIDDPEELFGYYECLKSMKRYQDADELVKNNLKNYENFREFSLNNNKLEYYKKLESFEGARLTLLPLNSKYSDISPTVYNNWIYFVSTRPASNNKEIHRINMQPYYNLYAVPSASDMLKVTQPKGDFGKPEATISYQNYTAGSLPNAINKKYHDGPTLVTPSGKMVFFTTNWSAEKRPKTKTRDVNLLIYYCEKIGNIWSEPKSFTFNSFTHSNQHGYFDEGSSTLYFSSNMPGGMGGYDIWKSTFKNGNWEKPVNLGEFVNTPKTEVFPSLTPDGRLLFSSNGWAGLGGLDLYIVDDPLSEPLNLMAGMNSELDDFGLVFTDRENGYLVSNRSGGAGDDDIYSFKLDLKRVMELMAVPKRVVVGKVKDAATGESLSDVRIVISNYFEKSYLTSADATLSDTLASRTGDKQKPEIVVQYEKEGYETMVKKFSSWPSDSDILDISESLNKVKTGDRVVAEQGKDKTGNLNNNQGNTQDNQQANDQLNKKDTPLVQVAVDKNMRFIIYFDFDKFNIRKDAAEILAKVAYVLLEEYEAAEVLLSGHTDTRGAYEYNERLSMNRVNTAKKWLVDRGIDPKRIRTDYHGERRLAILCNDVLYKESNPDYCLSREQHQLNRRVEIEIMNPLK